MTRSNLLILLGCMVIAAVLGVAAEVFSGEPADAPVAPTGTAAPKTPEPENEDPSPRDWSKLVKEGTGPEYKLAYKFAAGDEYDTKMEMSAAIGGSGEKMEIEMAVSVHHKIEAVTAEGNARTAFKCTIDKLAANGEDMLSLLEQTSYTITGVITPAGKGVKGTVKSDDLPAEVGPPENIMANALPPILTKPVKLGTIGLITDIISTEDLEAQITKNIDRLSEAEFKLQGIYEFKEIKKYEGHDCALITMKYEIGLTGKVDGKKVEMDYTFDGSSYFDIKAGFMRGMELSVEIDRSESANPKGKATGRMRVKMQTGKKGK
jgi:hypothetical protein